MRSRARGVWQSGRVELSFAFFADSAAVPPDGKLYVLGGGFSTLALAQLPARASFAVVAGFRFSAPDTGQRHQVELRFSDAEGKLVVPAATLQFQSQGPRPEPLQEVSISTVTYLHPMFAQPGTYVAEYWHEERPLAALRMQVIERRAPQPVPEVRPN
jgi:Family of unknown function (DUF6941)